MLTYTRRQILLLSLVVAGGAGGLAIDRWRRANPDVVTYLESLDRAPDASSREPAQRPAAATASAPRPVARQEHARGRRARDNDSTPVDVNLASAAELE